MSILVSVPVLTYNAAEFVEETLESIFNQTYSNIELIISDDCSKDNTVEIVTKWCEQDRVKARFTNIKIITVPKNTGIPANYNRCVNASSGEWIKMISGDDGLMANCVEDNVNYITKNTDIKVLYSYLKIYRNTFEDGNFVSRSPAIYPSHIITEEITAVEQYQLFLVSDRIQFTPSMFLNKEAILKAGLPKEHLFSEDFQTKLNF
jgi:alpha-1,3-rhamnosyltransferase